MKVQKVDFQRKKNKIISGIVVGFFILCAVVVCVVGRVRHVTVVGCEFYTEEQIKEMVLDHPFTRNTLGLYMTYTLGKGKEIPFVGRISVNVIGIDQVEIVVYEKSIVGCIQYMGEYIYFDMDGLVVESSTEKKEQIPLFEGVNFRRMTLYEPLEVEDRHIFNRIMDLSQLLSKYNISTDRVCLEQSGAVTLYSGDICIKLGKKDMYDEQIAELSKLLPKAKKKKLKGVLDMENFEDGQNKIIFQKES